MRSTLICYLHLLESLLAEFGLVAVISPVSVAHKAKSDGFDLGPYLDLTYDLLRKILTLLKKYSSRTFDCRLARLATATRSRVRRGGGLNLTPPPEWGAFGQIPQRGAG